MILSAIKRAAYTTIAFDIDERGEPDNFDVVDESADTWGADAVAFVKDWRFHPSMRNGEAIKVPCEMALMWGSTFAQQLDFISSPPSPEPSRYPPVPRPQPIAEDITQPQPEYTDAARKAGIEGVVWIDVIVDQAGVPQNPTVTLGLENMPASGLTLQALNAVLTWRFPQTVLNGEPTPRRGSVRIEFTLAGVRSTIFWDKK
jgi:TonB family protein